MNSRGVISRAAAAFALVSALAVPSAGAQGDPVRRLADRVSLAIEEYALGVDDKGKKVLQEEYDEAVLFLTEAKGYALRLPTEHRAAADLFDSIFVAVLATRPSGEVRALEARFRASLGSAASIELPPTTPDLAVGASLYAKQCASCHGPTGKGDGPMAASLNPRPPAVGMPDAMAAVTPATMFLKLSVGVRGTAMPGFESGMSAAERWSIVAYLVSLRATAASVAEGEGLYTQTCASCHGATGAGDAETGRRLSRSPPDIGSLTWQVAHSDSEMVHVVTRGMPGAPMPRAPGGWSATEVSHVVAYLRTFALKPRAVVEGAADPNDAEAVARRVLGLVRASLDSARLGRGEEGFQVALDAYAAFEPLESRAKALKPTAVKALELRFADLRTRVRELDVRGAEQAVGAIEIGMPRVVALAKPASTRWQMFVQSLLIIIREGFEAILVIGAVVAFLIKTGHRERLRAIWIGVALALVASLLTAVIINTVLRQFTGFADIIEGVTMLVAVAVLFSVSYWLISKVEAAKWQQFIRERVNDALAHGGGNALTFVAFLAVYREGAETALFYQALFNQGQNGVPIVLGIVAGGVILAVVFTLFYRYGVKIPLRPFFAVTSVLLYYMAFVFMGKGISELQEANVVSLTIIPSLPSIDAIGFYNSWESLLGQLVLVVLFLFALIKTFWPKRSITLPTMSAAPARNPEGQSVEARLSALQERIEKLEGR